MDTIDPPPSCASSVTLTDAERAFLDSLPDPMFVVDTALHCQLELDHTGPHLANGQDSGDDEWWLRWDDHHRDTICLPPCPATAPGADPSDGGWCLLPAGHQGHHSFELSHIA